MVQKSLQWQKEQAQGTSRVHASLRNKGINPTSFLTAGREGRPAAPLCFMIQRKLSTEDESSGNAWTTPQGKPAPTPSVEKAPDGAQPSEPAENPPPAKPLPLYSRCRGWMVFSKEKGPTVALPSPAPRKGQRCHPSATTVCQKPPGWSPPAREP